MLHRELRLCHSEVGSLKELNNGSEQGVHVIPSVNLHPRTASEAHGVFRNRDLIFISGG